jgi:AcrR family transcriptional regulator
VRLTRAEAKAANRTALLDAARLLVSQDGASVSVEAIASAAGLTTGAIYSIFGSKNDLLVTLISDNIARIDAFLDRIEDPSLTLEQAIDAFLNAWLTAYQGDTAQDMFTLQVILAAAEDENLTKKLTAATSAENRAIARHLVDRVVTEPDGTVRRTTPAEATDIAHALQAILSGFSLRENFSPAQSTDLVRRACASLARLATTR